jgi:hypothetical protein
VTIASRPSGGRDSEEYAGDLRRKERGNIFANGAGQVFADLPDGLFLGAS